MSFLHRKRRRDEAAASVDEAFPVPRVYGKNRGYHRMSQNTQVEPNDYNLHDSCVLRSFPKQKSSNLRFLAWVAYTRKFSDSSMSDTERRTCPLLWCRDVFPSEEAMLKHVYTCEYISKGLYWCFSCQKPERVGKFQCKQCQGTPSAADRITTVAKKIFSALGAKGTMRDHSALVLDRKFNPSKSPEALTYASESEKRVPFQDPVGEHEEWGDMMELPNNAISEMDAGNIFEMSAGWTMTSQELSGSQVPEMTGSDFAPMSSSDYSDEKSSHDPWGLSMNDPTPAPPYAQSPRRPSQPVLPRLNTCVTCEPAPQHHLWSDMPMSATVISPLSASDRIDFGTLDISPTDSEASGKSIFTDSGYSTATVASPWDESSSSLGWDKDAREARAFAANQGRLQIHVSGELPGDSPPLPNLFEVLPATLPDPLERHPSNSSSSSAVHSANRGMVCEKPQPLSAHWSDAKGLVESFSEVLQEHIQHSREALKKMPPNSNTKELLALSTNSIRSIGLEVLERLLEGRNPSSLVHIFSFTNVAYSMAVAVDRIASKVQTEPWFQHCLSWSTFLSSDRDRRRYEGIACAIWQPQSMINTQPVSFLLSSSIEKENKLLAACKHFLDLLQSLKGHDRSNTATRGLFDFARSSFVHKVKTRIIDQLIQKPSIEAFIEDIVDVEKRLNNNFIVDLRQLELELIWAAKFTSQSDTAYTRFTGHVTDLCDKVYAEESNTKSRAAHHIEAIALTSRLLPEDEYTDNEEEAENPQLDIDLQTSGLDAALHFNSTDIDTLIDNFSRDANELLDKSFDFSHFEFTSQATPVEYQPSFQPPPTPSGIFDLQEPATTASPDPQIPFPATTKYRCHCGYVPTGEERWKASNLSRHKRIQHPAKGGKVYKCQWDGCESTFTRSDNLREHARKKGHEVWGDGDGKEAGDGESKRKRRKRDVADEMDTGLR